MHTPWRKRPLRGPRIYIEHHAIAEQNLEQAESAEVQAGGDLVAAQAALKVMGITDPGCTGESSAFV